MQDYTYLLKAKFKNLQLKDIFDRVDSDSIINGEKSIYKSKSLSTRTFRILHRYSNGTHTVRNSKKNNSILVLEDITPKILYKTMHVGNKTFNEIIDFYINHIPPIQ